jgi:hypothetical protein
MSKKPIITESVRDEFSEKEQAILLSCFKNLMRAFPVEDHFSIDIGDRDRQGKTILYLIDETDAYPKGQFETMSTPEDE